TSSAPTVPAGATDRLPGMTRESSLPLPARVVIAIVSLCGLAVVANSVAVIARSTLPWEWVLFAVLTIASGMLTVKVPSIDAHVSVSEAFAFASVLLFGPHVGVVTLALDGVRVSFRLRMNAGQTAFNFANLGLSISAAGTIFFLSSGAGPLFEGGALSTRIVLDLALMTGTYFAVNS